MNRYIPARRRHYISAIAIMFVLSGCEMLELVGRAPPHDASMPDCLSSSICMD